MWDQVPHILRGEPVGVMRVGKTAHGAGCVTSLESAYEEVSLPPIALFHFLTLLEQLFKASVFMVFSELFQLFVEAIESICERLIVPRIFIQSCQVLFSRGYLLH